MMLLEGRAELDCEQRRVLLTQNISEQPAVPANTGYTGGERENTSKDNAIPAF